MVAVTPRRDHRGIRDFRPLPPPAPPGDPAPWCRAPRPGRGRPRLRGPIRRRHDDRLLGGIAGALAARTGRDVTLVRVVLVIAGLASGFGVAVYILVWLLVPADDGADSIAVRAAHDRRGLGLALALVPGLVFVLVITSALHAGWLGSLAWPLFIGAAGLILIWRNGSADERDLLRRAASPLVELGSGMGRSWTGLAWRLVIGALLAVGGTAALTGLHRYPVLRLGGIALMLAALVVVFGPWWLSVARELVLERQARLRAEERADLAARVHDSVLQTLTLIQRHADEPQRVAQLARAQERELRSWLFEGQRPGSFEEGLATVAAAVRRIQSDVEADHGTPIEAVVVGDGPLSDEIEALLAAGREATVNAAKWSGAPVVSLFVEVEAGKVSLFVRDRGRGFDLSAVGADRRGISESIRGRMARIGGKATIRSAPGAGTEVELTVARSPVTPAAADGAR